MNYKYILRLLFIICSTLNYGAVAQNKANLLSDSINQKFTYYNFFENKGLQIDNAITKKTKQSVIITYKDSEITTIQFNYKQKTKFLYATDSIKRMGYNIFLNKVSLDGDYEAVIFMSDNLISSFTYYADSRNKVFMNTMINEKDSVKLVSGWINDFNFQGIIDFFEKKDFKMSDCKFCNWATQTRQLSKTELAEVKKIGNNFLIWYEMVF